MQHLRPDDLDRLEFQNRDAVTMIEGELRQFDRRFDIAKRYVENIVTGAFLLVKKDVDLRQQEDSNRIQASRYQVEIELL